MASPRRQIDEGSGSSMENRIVQKVMQGLQQIGSSDIEPGDFRIFRVLVKSTSYRKVYTLPKDTAAWRMVNEDAKGVRWAQSDKPSDEGENSYALLPGKSSDAPPVYPSFIKKPVDLYMRTGDADQTINISIILTTSKDPRVIAALTNLNLGLSEADIQLGSVEIKDESSNVRVSVTSGPDGVSYVNTDTSGATVNLGATSGALKIQIADADDTAIVADVTSGSDGVRRLEASIVATSAVTIIRSRSSSSGIDTIAIVPSGYGPNIVGIPTASFLAGRNQLGTAGEVGFVVAVNAAPAAVADTYVPVVGTIPMPLIGTQVWGQLRATSGGDGIVYLETDASGAVVVGSMYAFGGTTPLPERGNTSGIQYVTPVADVTVGMVYSGVVSFASNTASGATVLIGIAAPVNRNADDLYVVDVWHAAISSSLKVIANRIMVFGSNTRRLQIGSFTVDGPGSGESGLVQGLFAGGTTGEIAIMVVGGGTAEAISAEINIRRL